MHEVNLLQIITRTSRGGHAANGSSRSCGAVNSGRKINYCIVRQNDHASALATHQEKHIMFDNLDQRGVREWARCKLREQRLLMAHPRKVA